MLKDTSPAGSDAELPLVLNHAAKVLIGVVD
jgi:hypothetical protein